MKIAFLFLAWALFFSAAAQKTSFDIVAYKEPAGWQKQATEGTVVYSRTDKKTGGWCQIAVYKSLGSKGSVEADFSSEWKALVVKTFPGVKGPVGDSVVTANGWQIKAGAGTFRFKGAPGTALLTTFSGYNTCVSILTSTNHNDFLKEAYNLIGTVSLTPPTVAVKDKPATENSSENPPFDKPFRDGFAFGTTTFDDGWKSSVQSDWVEVTKGGLKLLLHYPRPMKNHVVFPAEIKTAWDTLVSVRYHGLKNFKTTYINGYQYTDMACGTVTENGSGLSKFVLLFRRAGSGWIEAVAPDKTAFVQAFGFDPEAMRWDSDGSRTDLLANMVGRNKFAVAAADLYGTGEWKEHYSSNSFWANYYTGAYEGMSTYSSSQWFVFGEGRSYTWNLIAASSYGGKTNVAGAKRAGTFSSPTAWQLYFTDIEGKPKTYDAYYTAVKSGRVLWLNDTKYPGSGVFTGYSK